jgi:hypothetical protein
LGKVVLVATRRERMKSLEKLMLLLELWTSKKPGVTTVMA